MKKLISENIKNYMRKSFNNRRILTESGENVPALIRSIDNGQNAIKFPTQTEGFSGERIFDLPEIPCRAEMAAKPILLFRGKFPADSKGQPITDVSALSAAANRLQEGTDFILSGSKERPTAVKLINPGNNWTYTDENGKTQYHDINYYFWGLGTVLTAFDFENMQNQNIKTDVAEIGRLAAAELYSDEINIIDLIKVIAGKCEIHDSTEIGVIKMWGGEILPKNLSGGSNYLFCEGQTLSKKDYPELAAAWGITVTTFKLPDFTGRTPIGAGTYTEKDSYYTTDIFGTGGERNHEITINEMPKHSHNLSLGRKDGDGSYKDTSFLTPGTSWTDRDTASVGGSQPMSLMQPYVGVKFIVRYK